MAIALSASAAVVWDGGSFLDSGLATAENWVDDVLPAITDDVVFTGSVRTDPQVPFGGITYQSVAFDANASSFVLGGPAPLTVTGLGLAIASESVGVQTFAIPVSLTGTDGSAETEVRATGGDLTFDNLSLGNAKTTRLLGGGNTITINGNLISLDGSGSLNIGTATTGDDFANTPTVVLASDNTATFTKRMGINGDGGTLRLAASGAAGANDGTTVTTLVIRGGSSETGVVELVNGITIDKMINPAARTADAQDATHLRSIGNNTLSGRIYTSGSSGFINLESVSGTFTMSGSIEQKSGTMVARFRGDGDFHLNGEADPYGSFMERSGVWRVAKLGAGTLTFDSPRVAYTGDTAVFEGTLELLPYWAGGNPALDATPRITVAAGATLDVSAMASGGDTDLTLSDTQTLGGSGAVVGNLVGSSGTVISPGGTVNDYVDEYTETAGALSFDGDLDMSAGANMIWDLGALSEANPGTDFDTLSVSGALELGGSSQLTLRFGVLEESLRPDAATPVAFWGSDRSWMIASAGGGLTGDFSVVDNGSFAGVGTFTTRVSGDSLFLDFDSVYTPQPTIPGDTNGDQKVDAIDAAKVAQFWGANVGAGGYASGDFNGDQVVDMKDASIMAANWGDHSSEAGATVPEPGAVALLLCLALAAMNRRRRQ